MQSFGQLAKLRREEVAATVPGCGWSTRATHCTAHSTQQQQQHSTARRQTRPDVVVRMAGQDVSGGLRDALIENLNNILSPQAEVRRAAEEQIHVLEVTEGE